MAKKLAKKIAAKDAQCMLRLPLDLRDKVAARAAQNGRSMDTEIIEAIEHHLRGADRITRLWEFFERHRESIESVPLLLTAVENLEISAERSKATRSVAVLVQPADCDSAIVSLITKKRQRDSAMLLYFLVPWILVTLLLASPLPDILRGRSGTFFA